MARRHNPLTPEERFWAKVHQTPSGCWEWDGGDNFYDGVASVAVHRYTWKEIAKKDLAPRQIIRRTCGNSRCVNPDHFELELSPQLKARMAKARSKVQSPKIKGDKFTILAEIIRAMYPVPNLKSAYTKTASKYSEKPSAIKNLMAENSLVILWGVARQRVLGRHISEAAIKVQKNLGLACDEFDDLSLRTFLDPETTWTVFQGRGDRNQLIADWQEVNRVIGELQGWLYRPQAPGIKISDLVQELKTRDEVLRTAALALKIPVTKPTLNIEKLKI